MKNIIITGTNGMIGRLILDICLESDEVNMVTSITRKPLPLNHPKLIKLLHDDFMDYSKIDEHLKGHHVCFYCIGVYTGQVSANEFKKVTVDFTKAFAEALKRNNRHCSFCFLSGQGADRSEKSRLLFAREKGIAENNLLRCGFDHTYIFRPGYIYPVTPRKEPNALYRFMRIIYKPLSVVYPNGVITSEKLAQKMFTIGMHGGTKNIYENHELRR